MPSSLYNMNFNFITLGLLCVISDFIVSLQSTKEANDVQKFTSKIPYNDYVPTPDAWDTNPDLKSLWMHRPLSVQSNQADEKASQHVILKPPHVLTRLAKPISDGFDPFFDKAHFEPFERRPRPVTLVAFRKNGLLRKLSNPINLETGEVAELQSPYNDISTFWHDAPDFVNV